MASYLINKNIVVMYRLRKIVGRRLALLIARAIEWAIVRVLGRDKLV